MFGDTRAPIPGARLISVYKLETSANARYDVSERPD